MKKGWERGTWMKKGREKNIKYDNRNSTVQISNLLSFNKEPQLCKSCL